LPPRARVVSTPEDFTVEHRCFRVSRRTVVRGQNIAVTTDYQRTCTELGVEDYPDVRRLAQRANTQLQADIVYQP
jgi:hypothetical protein